MPLFHSTRTLVLSFTALLACTGALARSPASSMPGMDMSTMPADSAASSSAAFQAADHSMMGAMSNAPYTGNADHDFVAHMLPHHQGAVAMAKVELQYGKDPKLRALAKEIIAAQNKEIAFMKQWQATHPSTK
jgi:uncharacterized protein (DUF305 family)